MRRQLLWVFVTTLTFGVLVELIPTTRAADAVSPATRASATDGALWVGSDPWVVLHDGVYYHCDSIRNRIEVWKSKRPDDRGQRAIVWRAPSTGWNRAEVWAPELHRVRGRWYIYYAASAGENASHRMGVLEATTDDPQGPYIDRGMLYTGDDPATKGDARWAIDGTVLDVGDRLYLAWSGWEDERDVQYLYIAPMSDPTTVSGPRVRICANDTYPWERVGEDSKQRGLHEAPELLVHDGRVFLVYSCSGSWQSTYKLGMLRADASADLLDPKSWRKLERPVFESTDEVFGVGHCAFTTSPDGRRNFITYHSKIDRREGWERVVRMQPFRWTEDGLPDFGRPLRTRVGPTTTPAAEKRD